MSMSPGTIPGQGTLDSPPPSPAVQTGLGPGIPLGSIAPKSQPQIPSGQLPPDVLTGMLKAGQGISQTLDAFAQTAPDLASDFGQIKDLLLTVLSKVMMAGGGPTAPTATGANFPGGGVDQGGMPLASGGN